MKPGVKTFPCTVCRGLGWTAPVVRTIDAWPDECRKCGGRGCFTVTGLARLLGGQNAAARRRARYAITRAIDGEVLRGDTGVRLLEQLVPFLDREVKR